VRPHIFLRRCVAFYFVPYIYCLYIHFQISVLKAKLRRVFNNHYGAFDDDLRAAFIEESRNVFRLNIEVVRTIKGVNRANLRKLALALIFVSSIVVAVKFALK